jgi:hypothetical protein
MVVTPLNSSNGLWYKMLSHESGQKSRKGVTRGNMKVAVCGKLPENKKPRRFAAVGVVFKVVCCALGGAAWRVPRWQRIGLGRGRPRSVDATPLIPDQTELCSCLLEMMLPSSACSIDALWVKLPSSGCAISALTPALAQCLSRCGIGLSVEGRKDRGAWQQATFLSCVVLSCYVKSNWLLRTGKTTACQLFVLFRYVLSLLNLLRADCQCVRILERSLALASFSWWKRMHVPRVDWRGMAITWRVVAEFLPFGCQVSRMRWPCLTVRISPLVPLLVR